ncbi:formate dehydrogenase accessory sulfurtransferase FdhD [Paenibacillus sp. HB172176]|uniref:formate dehydrogenase accessory sulfurtransferase FdhD n=1 Tax=Paenibacillus sp. HB172176 TaxID=2493690 RepID=UPI00143C1721|nr:formate dehydrogenase accessory sulfurtransferase FdhD [Paenibacillus sp. HB172176]
MAAFSVKRNILKFTNGKLLEQEDDIASEFALTIVVNREEFATIVCTPTHLEELVVGFLASEGVIRRAEEIVSIRIVQERGFAYIELTHPYDNSDMLHSKRFIGSCCGKSRQFYLQSDVRTAKTIMTREQVSIRSCIGLMAQLQASSPEFRLTGGMHNAALCASEQLISVRSDIGRHNALDKLFGYALLHKMPMRGKVLAFSGRLSSEVLLKAAKIGVGVILSKSAPTALALDLADELGITAIGFIRNDECNIYTHPERILLP